jgi:protein-S-isoprenylcysteine O-methyltransferase Ste14
VDTPGVTLPPPIVYIAFYLVGLVLQFFLPLPLLLTYPTRFIGWLIAFVSLILAVAGFRELLSARTTFRADRAASSLITTGVYRFTRNPLYLSLLLLYCGVGIFFGELWPLALTPVLVVTMDWQVISREERYLADKFGPAFEDYRRSVRRWL